MRCITTALLILSALLSAPEPAAAELCRDAQIVFLYDGGDAQQRALDKSIEGAVLELNAVVRPFARRFLKRFLKIPESITYEKQGSLTALTVPPYPPRLSTLDGRPHKFTNVKGSQSTLRRHLEGRSIIETSRNSHGQRRIIYRFAPSCQRLETEWTIESRRILKGPINFTLSYRRR